MARKDNKNRNLKDLDYEDLNKLNLHKKEYKDSEDELKDAVANDHVFIQFTNNYRCEANFIKTTTLVVDCDNSHSDDPKDWIHKEDVEMAFPGVAFVIYTSRNHLKIKGNKSDS